jgi:hypothetical protein
MLQFGASFTGDTSSVIYDRIMFMIQASEWSRNSHPIFNFKDILESKKKLEARPIEQHILDTNAGKQLPYAATDV